MSTLKLNLIEMPIKVAKLGKFHDTLKRSSLKGDITVNPFRLMVGDFLIQPTHGYVTNKKNKNKKSYSKAASDYRWDFCYFGFYDQGKFVSGFNMDNARFVHLINEGKLASGFGIAFKAFVEKFPNLVTFNLSQEEFQASFQAVKVSKTPSPSIPQVLKEVVNASDKLETILNIPDIPRDAIKPQVLKDLPTLDFENISPLNKDLGIDLELERVEERLSRFFKESPKSRPLPRLPKPSRVEKLFDPLVLHRLEESQKALKMICKVFDLDLVEIGQNK